jgi:hypothetical protein
MHNKKEEPLTKSLAEHRLSSHHHLPCTHRFTMVIVRKAKEVLQHDDQKL